MGWRNEREEIGQEEREKGRKRKIRKVKRWEKG